jgi:hypothetical protein
MKDEIDIILMFGEISHHHLFQIIFRILFNEQWIQYAYQFIFILKYA